MRDFLDAPPFVGAAAGARGIGVGRSRESARTRPAGERGGRDDEEGCERGPAEDFRSRRPDLVIGRFDHADHRDARTALLEIRRSAGLVGF